MWRPRRQRDRLSLLPQVASEAREAKDEEAVSDEDGARETQETSRDRALAEVHSAIRGRTAAGTTGLTLDIERPP